MRCTGAALKSLQIVHILRGESVWVVRFLARWGPPAITLNEGGLEHVGILLLVLWPKEHVLSPHSQSPSFTTLRALLAWAESKNLRDRSDLEFFFFFLIKKKVLLKYS